MDSLAIGATPDSLEPFTSACKKTVLLDGLIGVLRARRLKVTGGSKQSLRTTRCLIPSNGL
jgi:hypothetical protein